VTLVYDNKDVVRISKVDATEMSSGLLAQIATHHSSHAGTTEWYLELDREIKANFIPLVSEAMKNSEPFQLNEVGEILFPWLSFGSINSSHLFGLDELVIFSYYLKNKDRYSNFLDLGANVGLHSLVASKLGMNVTAVEPDPTHLIHLADVIARNALDSVEVITGAATVSPGPVMFLRVEGNSTGSHISGAKKSPYGELTQIEVNGYPVLQLVKGKDLVKMDVEGLEADLLESLGATGFSSFDLLAEVGSPENASRIFELSRGWGANVYSQKINWGKVKTAADLPCHHSEGSIFISTSPSMLWN